MPTHLYEPGMSYLLTMVTKGRRPVFAEQKQGQTKYASDPARFFLSKIVEDYERHVSYRVNRIRGTRGVAVWQNGFRDDALRTAHAVRGAVEYVRMNPVRAGLSEDVGEYPWLAWDAEWLV